MVLGLGVDVLGPRGIVLEGRDRSNARSVRAEAVDHGLPILADETRAQLIPAPHRPALRHAGVICGVKWAQTSRNKLLVDPFSDRGPAVFLEARGIEHPVAECSVALLSLNYPVGYGLGRHLEAHVRARGPVPLTITEQSSAGDDP